MLSERSIHTPAVLENVYCGCVSGVCARGHVCACVSRIHNGGQRTTISQIFASIFMYTPGTDLSGPSLYSGFLSVPSSTERSHCPLYICESLVQCGALAAWPCSRPPAGPLAVQAGLLGLLEWPRLLLCSFDIAGLREGGREKGGAILSSAVSQNTLQLTKPRC